MVKTAGDVISALSLHASEKRLDQNQYYFKTGPGQYAEGDLFMGVSMPSIRKVAKTFEDLELSESQQLLAHEIHEVRLCALIVLVLQYKSAEIDERKKIVKFYLQNTAGINNWDLVDCSAHYVLGQSVLDGINDRKLLFELAGSELMWERRIAIVSTWILIRSGDIQTTLSLSVILLHNTEDLIHKAVGWMLRESWKVYSEKVENFLIEHYDDLPRTTLRYTIERMEETKRKKFLKGDF